MGTIEVLKPKIAFTTLGCRVNQYDTQAMREQVEKFFLPVDFTEQADIYVINTCTVTAAADSQGKQLVRRAKAKNPGSFVVVTGCLAQDRPEEIAALAGVDLVVGNEEKSLLLEKIAKHSGLVSFSGGSLPKSPWGGGITRFDGHQRATLKVQDGCGFGCSFCLIPRVRGEMVSRPGLEIIEEGKKLAANGVKELVLAGIQLSSYGRDWGLGAEEPRLAPVIEKLLGLPGVKRVRLSSYAVADFEDALLPLWESKLGLCPHLHLPLQSGDAEVLKSMRRPYRLDHFSETVRKVRKRVPDLGLTSDIIAGFPAETEEAFQNTLDKIREFNFADFHPFPYSDRTGTPGEKMRPKVAPREIRERMERLLSLKKELLADQQAQNQGRVFPVIVEKHGKKYQSGLASNGLRILFDKREGGLGREALVKVEGEAEGRAFGRVLEEAELLDKKTAFPR